MITITAPGQTQVLRLSDREIAQASIPQLEHELERIDRDLFHFWNMRRLQPQYCTREPMVQREGQVLRSEQRRIRAELSRRAGAPC